MYDIQRKDQMVHLTYDNNPENRRAILRYLRIDKVIHALLMTVSIYFKCVGFKHFLS